MTLAATGSTEAIVGALVALLIAGLGVLSTIRIARIKSDTDNRLNALTAGAEATKIKADATDRLVDQLQEQLINSAKAEIDIRKELLECHRRETDLLVELAQTKAMAIVAHAEAKANHNAVETRVDRIEQLFTLVKREITPDAVVTTTTTETTTA